MRDKDSLLCDMAEFYHMTDYQGLPVQTLAALVFGLPEGSRTKRRLSGVDAPTETMILALIADRLAVLIWQNTEDGRNGVNYPTLITPLLTGEKQPEKQEETVFRSAEDFERARARLLDKEG